MSITRPSTARHCVAALFVMLLAAPMQPVSAGAVRQAPLPADTGIEMSLPMSVHLVPATKTAHVVHTVGSHANCDFSDLQVAINAAGQDDVLQIARSNAYLGKTYTIFGKSLVLRGGFDTCDPDETPSGHTTLDANNASTRVIDIWEGNSPPTRHW